jgi:hypothetical protein
MSAYIRPKIQPSRRNVNSDGLEQSAPRFQPKGNRSGRDERNGNATDPVARTLRPPRSLRFLLGLLVIASEVSFDGVSVCK